MRKDRTVATIRATCPTCGDVELSSDDMQVLVCSSDQSAAYSFQCPECLVMITKPTDHRVVDVLVSSGVALRSWDIPAEVTEIHSGPPVSWDEILEFHLLLNEPGNLERALSALA